MTDLRKAAEMALGALCSSNPIGHALEDYEHHNKATEALRQALAQKEYYVHENEKREHEYHVYREALEGLSSAVHDFKTHTNIYWGKAPSDAFVTLYAAPPRTGKPVAAVELIEIGSEQVIAVAWYDSNAFKVGTKLYIAPPSKQEPVAYKYADKHNPLIFYFTTHKDALPNSDVIETKLYIAPPSKPWVSLTDEEIITIRADAISNMSVDFQNTLCRAIEAALRSKNDPTSN